MASYLTEELDLTHYPKKNFFEIFGYLDIISGSFEGQEIAHRSSRCLSPPGLLN